ncbi:MAG: HEAT repeat domain-containing protein [Candidatus Marinimicrobia bacterium]|nr:HEAT repeat domain-containing protein [Candidatus Neomarinimicrobiota bacterium]
MKKRFTILFLVLGIFLTSLVGQIEIIEPTQDQQNSFAIVVDNLTYSEIPEAVNNYKKAVEDDGLACYTLVVQTAKPSEIKAKIESIYEKERAFEGIVLVGDIPVPMLRDAQHLSSAFKMDQERFPFNRSSVASDRYYDDFDLRFEFQQQDTANSSFYYYSLLPESPQYIEKEIYSARIKVPLKGDQRLKALNKYLNRVAEQKQEVNTINEMLSFTGHGYYSESLTAWEWELLSLREQFPQLYQPGNMIKNLNHASSSHMKEIILTEMQRPELDIVFFHAHGANDAQYLNGYPPAENINQNISSITRYLRSRLRRAKRWGHDPEEAKEYFMNKYNVPEKWFEGAFVDSMVQADSLYSASLDIYPPDLKNVEPEAEFIMFDECYNGQFTKIPYIAGEYVFSEGNTIVAAGNTVNVKQDIWADELLGMLNLGLRAGEWHKTRNYLESHLIGDPTFHFNDQVPADLIKNLYANKGWWSSKKWNDLLQSTKPALRTLAVYQLYQQKKSRFVPDLVKIYHSDNSFNVRMEALKCLAASRSSQFEEILKDASRDPSEMIRRKTMVWMGKVGRQEYLPYLADRVFKDHSDRVSRHAKESMGFIDAEKAALVSSRVLENMPSTTNKKGLEDRIIGSLKNTQEWLYDELLPTMKSDTMEVKEKIGAARTFRNYTFHNAVDDMTDLMLDSSQDLKFRIKIAEALGWFTFSINRQEIVKACDKIIQKEDSPESLQAEALKTKNRIQQGPNNPITP